MSPDELERNYVALVRSGAHTWESLRITAERSGWRAVVAICDKHIGSIETADRSARETAVRKKKVAE